MSFTKKAAKTLLFLSVGFISFEIYRAANAEAFNRRMERLSIEHHLIGKSESEVIAVLGSPSNRRVYRNGDFTLNYRPSRLWPFDKFQAHFAREGMLRTIELMDD